MRVFQAAYTHLSRNGELVRRAEALERLESECSICPRKCGARRHRGEKGACRASSRASVVSAFAHRGEEPQISGLLGSGTIFFGHCNLSCVFCQNHDVSQDHEYAEVHDQDPAETAGIMLSLQRSGCHNINWVSPTHSIAAIVRALAIAAGAGLTIPVVYNSNGYDSVEVLRLLEGVVDIYMPDIKYSRDDMAGKLSGVNEYTAVSRAAAAEMYRQVGDLVMDETGVARHGLLIRHLVLPDDLAGTSAILDWIAAELGPNVTVNVMGQYHPAYRACEHPGISRRVTPEEHARAVAYARRHLTNVIA